jgi:hypothetical protein
MLLYMSVSHFDYYNVYYNAYNNKGNIKPTYFATYAFPAPRYGHLTSNIAESLNGAWKDIRHLTPLRMLVAIWQKVMQTFASRRQRTTTGQLLPSVQKAFDKRLTTSRRYTAMASSPTKYFILGKEGSESIVDLRIHTCTCMQFQEFGGPCSHALVAARSANVDPTTLFDHYFKPLAWNKMYKSSWSHLSPFLTTNLEADDTLPPLVKRRQGRPKIKRIRKSVALQDRQNKCSNPWCRQKGHNKRSCQTVEAQDGIVEDCIRENSTDSSNERGSGSLSDGAKETPTERLQRLRVDRAKRAIAKRRQQRALVRGEKVPRGRKKKKHVETDKSSSTNLISSGDNENISATLSEIEVIVGEESFSDNASMRRIDTDIADAVRRGVTPDIVRRKRTKEAQDTAAAAAISIAEDERRNDPFRSPTPQQQTHQQTRKRLREQGEHTATRRLCNPPRQQSQRVFTLRNSKKRG